MSDVEGWIKEGKYDTFFHFHNSLGFGKQRSDYGRLKQQIDQVPVFGFNSGRYDINLIKSDLFAIIGTDNIKSVTKNPSYMCIATSNMKMLDISNYVPAGTSYDKYLTTYLGGCKCDDKIRCVCGLGKGLFPYEYITAFNVLNQTTIPPKSAFDSKLRGTSISDDEYERVKFVWGYYGMKSIKDLLVWYNNLDVVPFIKAIKAQRELFMRFDLDMFADDRINNKIGHIDGNVLVSCIKCNTARKDMSLRGFRYKKLLEFNSDRLVYSIDKEEKDIYAKMKANIAGGPSIIFNRYAKRNETKIRGGKLCKKIIGYDGNALYLWALGNEMPCGRLTTIEAYDDIVEDIVCDKIFGFLECDIRTPDHLKEYFSEMTPIFKNTLIDCADESVIGHHMYKYNEARQFSQSI
uniref:DNA-directed DNA polymerase n=1 Tax=Phytophthora ramorum TaxID=164328 RepID=H3GPU1_PHYRM